MDDSEFVYRDAQHVDERMAEAKALGFDRIRVSVYWRVLAPKPAYESFKRRAAANPRGFVVFAVRRRGSYRIVWANGGASRAVSVGR